MSGRYFCMYCGAANYPSPYASHIECKSCNQAMELPHHSSTSSVASSPSTPSASTVSSRCLSITSGSLSPTSTSSNVPDLSLESTSEDDDIDTSNTSINPSTKKRRRSSAKKRDPRAPKRAANAYMLFCKHQRPLLRASRPDLPFAVIGQTLGDMWRNMTITQRKPYEARAADERDRYKMEMHAFTAQTLRHNQTLQGTINQPINPELLQAMAHNLQMQAQAAQWADASINQSMNQPMIQNINQSMIPSVNQINQPMKQSFQTTTNQSNINPSLARAVPQSMMVQQAPQQHHYMQKQQRYTPYDRPINQSNNRLVNPALNQTNDWAVNNQSLNVEPIHQSNNQFQYGPGARDRRFSYQSMSSIHQSMNSSASHGLISAAVKAQVADQYNHSFNQSTAPFTFETFNGMDNQNLNQSLNQSINPCYEFPNDHLDFDGANGGIWESVFNEM